MDGNFRAVGRTKDGGYLDFSLHPGQMFFREQVAFREYLKRVTDEAEVCDCRNFDID